MVSLRIIALFSSVLISNAFSDDSSFMGRRVNLPSGWTRMPDNRELCGVSDPEMLVLRNTEGTAWIVAVSLPEPRFTQESEKMKDWRTLDSGSIANCPFAIMARPDRKHFERIVFPTLKTIVSFLLTTKGSQDPAEALKWHTPPEGKEYDLAFGKVKDATSAIIAEFDRSPKE
jgi:hypothetical protein